MNSRQILVLSLANFSMVSGLIAMEKTQEQRYLQSIRAAQAEEEQQDILKKERRYTEIQLCITRGLALRAGLNKHSQIMANTPNNNNLIALSPAVILQGELEPQASPRAYVQKYSRNQDYDSAEISFHDIPSAPSFDNYISHLESTLKAFCYIGKIEKRSDSCFALMKIQCSRDLAMGALRKNGIDVHIAPIWLTRGDEISSRITPAILMGIIEQTNEKIATMTANQNLNNQITNKTLGCK